MKRVMLLEPLVFIFKTPLFSMLKCNRIDAQYVIRTNTSLEQTRLINAVSLASKVSALFDDMVCEEA